MEFEVLTAVVMKSSDFWDITPCSTWKSADISEERVASMFLRNVGWLLVDYMALYPRRKNL
jgi:hypothetical protein